MEYDMNPGNFLLKCIKKEISQLAKNKDELLLNSDPTKRQIFAFGIGEVNRLFT